MTGCIRSWPNVTAPSITSSDSSFASDSTIRTALLVPATTRSRSDSASAANPGLSRYRPSAYPTRAAPIGPLNGIPEQATAADAPTMAGMSGSMSGSTEITVAMIWVSLRKPLGNRGRIGRSISRQVRISFSPGRPSRRKKPPGMRPAA